VFLLVLIFDYNVFNRDFKQIVLAIIVTLLELIPFIVVLRISLLLVHRLNARDVTPFFLAQSYLCTIVLFAGLYFGTLSSTEMEFDSINLTR
jgi:hypothetical protein